MSVGCTLKMFEILQDVNIAKAGRASIGENGNNLPCLHCERRTISAPKLTDMKKTVCLHTRQVL
jgi:hypothetical protein